MSLLDYFRKQIQTLSRPCIERDEVEYLDVVRLDIICNNHEVTTEQLVRLVKSSLPITIVRGNGGEDMVRVVPFATVMEIFQ